MGNKPKENEEQEDYITFEILQESLQITEPQIFKKYLQEIFNDLSSKSKLDNIKYMSKTTFYDYIKLPIFISEKLFSSFCKRNKEGLTIDEFVNGFFKLYTGSFEDTAKIIFDLLDFNKDKFINIDDVKMILTFTNKRESKNKW